MSITFKRIFYQQILDNGTITLRFLYNIPVLCDMLWIKAEKVLSLLCALRLSLKERLWSALQQ